MKLKWWWRLSLAVVVLGVTAGPAFADCVNVSRPDKANVQIAAHSPSFLTLDELLLYVFEAPAGSLPDVGRLALDLCPQGAQYLLDKIHTAAAQPGSGIDLTWVFSNEALQSGGLGNASNPHAKQNTSNGKGIDLLRENVEIWAVIEANIGTARVKCGP